METETVVEVDVIETFAGNGKSRSTGDGKRAIKAGIPLPNQLTVDRQIQTYHPVVSQEYVG